MLSLRVSVQRTGLPRWRASQTTIVSSAPKALFAPKPPPTSGAMTRNWPGSIPSVAARPKWSRCGTWVESHAVIRPSGPTSAAAERTSSGQAARRWLTSVSRTTTSQPSKSLGSWSERPARPATLVPISG
jgi:hypothetical protein